MKTMKTLSLALFIVFTSLGNSNGQEVEVISEAALQKTFAVLIGNPQGVGSPLALQPKDQAELRILTKPYLYLRESFPEEALRRELHDSGVIIDKLCGGAELPKTVVLGRELAKQMKLDRDMLVLLVRIHRKVLAEIAEHYEPQPAASGDTPASESPSPVLPAKP